MLALTLRLAGIIPPICTPFLEGGEVAYGHLRENIEKYNDVALTGYVATGSTGESAFLSTSEKLRIWEVVREAAAPGKLVIAGVGVESTQATITLIAAAAERGCDAALVLTPHYYKGQMARAESQLGYFRAVAEAARIPVLIYNFPQVTGIDLPAQVVCQRSPTRAELHRHLFPGCFGPPRAPGAPEGLRGRPCEVAADPGSAPENAGTLPVTARLPARRAIHP